MPVKPFTLMGEGMLVTVGALMPGGVLPPAATGQTGKDEEKQKHSTDSFCLSSMTLWRSFTLTGSLVTPGNVSGAGSVGR